MAQNPTLVKTFLREVEGKITEDSFDSTILTILSTKMIRDLQKFRKFYILHSAVLQRRNP